MKLVCLDICVAVGKITDKYPFYCDNYLNYVLLLELDTELNRETLNLSYMTHLRIV